MSAILLQPKEVPLNAVMFICPPDETEPCEDLPVIALLGGVPMRRKWYPCDLNGKNLSAGSDTILDGVRFSPANSYSPENAPVGHKLRVYVEGKWQHYEGYPDDLYLDVTRLPDGSFMSIDGYNGDYYRRRYRLPEGAILVPHGLWKDALCFDDAVKMRVDLGPASEMLRKAGAFFHGEFVWLPAGWKTVFIGEKVFSSGHRGRQEELLDDIGVRRATILSVTHPRGQTQYDVSVV